MSNSTAFERKYGIDSSFHCCTSRRDSHQQYLSHPASIHVKALAQMKRLQKFVDKKIDNALNQVTDRFTRTVLGEEYVQYLQHDEDHVGPSYYGQYYPNHPNPPQQPDQYQYHQYHAAGVTSPSSYAPYSPVIHSHHVQPPVPPSHPSFPPQPFAQPSPHASPPIPAPQATTNFNLKSMSKQESKPGSQNEKTGAVLDEVFNSEPQGKLPSALNSAAHVPFTPSANPSAASYSPVLEERLMDAHMDKVMPPDAVTKSYRYRTAIAELEQAHDTMPGPRWRLVRDTHLIGRLHGPGFESTMSNVRYVLSGIENGVTFSTLNASRYNDLGDSVLDRVLVGLSRPIDLSSGVQDLQILAMQIVKRDKAAVTTSVQDIRNSTVPIFAILYEPQGGGASPSTGFGISQPQMDQLYTILHTLTAGRKARIWLADIAMLSFSRGARWERLSVIPYALFPAIVLCGSKRKEHFGMLRTVQEQVARDCLGVIQLDAPDGDLEHEAPWDEKSTRLQFRSRVNPRVTKMVGPLKTIQSSLCVVAVGVLCGYFSTYVSSLKEETNEEGVERIIFRELRTLSILVMRGESLSNLVLGFGNAERALKLDGHEEKVLKALARHSKVYDFPMKPQKKLNASAGKWNGVVEFVGDMQLGRKLGLQNMKRSYICAYNTKSQWIAALGKVEGVVELYGLLLIRRTSAEPHRGIVEMYFPNFPAKRRLPTIFMTSPSETLGRQLLFSCFQSHIGEDAVEIFQHDADWQGVNLTYEDVLWS